MSFRSFFRTAITLGTALDATNTALDITSRKAKAGSISSELIAACQELRNDFNIDETFGPHLKFLEDALNVDQKALKNISDDQIFIIGAAFIEISFIGFILHGNYHDKLIANIIEEGGRDEYGDISKKKLTKVLRNFFESRVEDLVQHSRTILSADNFAAASSPTYTHGIIDEDAKPETWAKITYDTIISSGVIETHELLADIQDDHDADFAFDRDEEEATDVVSLVNHMLECDWECADPEYDSPFYRFVVRSAENLVFYVIYHEDKFDKEAFIYEINIASALMENGDCHLVLFFTEDHDLCDELEAELEDNFLAIHLSVADMMIRSALSNLQE